VADAIKRVLAARESLGIYVIVVDALNEIARDFYVSFGFTASGRDVSALRRRSRSNPVQLRQGLRRQRHLAGAQVLA
jgi:hypothetical protein